MIRVAGRAAQHPVRQRENHGVGVAGDDEVGGVDAAEDAVHRGQQVEDAEHRQHAHRRTTGGAAVVVGVEAHHHVGQAHRAEERRHDQRVGEVRRVGALQRLDPVGRVEVTGRGTVSLPGHPEHEHGHQQGAQLEPVLERLHQRDAAHAAGHDVHQHDGGDDHRAHPGRRTGQRTQGQPGALELRDEVEHTDQAHQPAGHPTREQGLDAELGEVGKRVGAGAAQGCGDEHQQQEVAGRPADRVPQHVDAARQHQTGDAQERRGGQVLATDGRGVEERADPARRHEEVARGARDAQPEGADRQRRPGDQGDREQGDETVHGLSGRSTRSSKAASLRSARRTYHQASTRSQG